MVVIPAGTAIVGASANDKFRNADELPERRVAISQPFAVSRYEITRDQYEAVLNQVGDVQRVVMLTVKAPKPWIEGNNAIIRSLPETHPNVIVLDWEARAAEISGHLSSSDGGVHLGDDIAKQFYRDIILEALGLPT